MTETHDPPACLEHLLNGPCLLDFFSDHRWKTVWQVLKKLNIELLYDPESLLLSIYLRELKTHIHTET